MNDSFVSQFHHYAIHSSKVLLNINIKYPQNYFLVWTILSSGQFTNNIYWKVFVSLRNFKSFSRKILKLAFIYNWPSLACVFGNSPQYFKLKPTRKGIKIPGCISNNEIIYGKKKTDHQGLYSSVSWDLAMPVNEKNSVLLSNKCDDPEEIW